jgi:hypothetical protein
MAGVVGEAVQGLTGPAVGGQAEVHAAGLARGAGDRVAPASAAACSALVVRSRIGPELGEELAEAELAHAGQPGEQAGLGVLAEPVADRLVELADGGKHGRQQLDLGADELGEHSGVEPDGWVGGRVEPSEELGGTAPAAVGVPAAERGHRRLGELGSGLPGRELGQEGQGDLEASRKKTCLAPGQWASRSAPSWLLAAVLAAT